MRGEACIATWRAREAGSAVGADFLGDARLLLSEPGLPWADSMLRHQAQRTQTRCCHRAVSAARKFVYGNYDAILRVAQHADAATTSSLRLRALRPEWFLRECGALDIGCNSGLITAAIAETFGPRQIVGLDIDERLVARARALVVQQAAAARVVYDAPAQAAAGTCRRGTCHRGACHR